MSHSQHQEDLKNWWWVIPLGLALAMGKGCLSKSSPAPVKGKEGLTIRHGECQICRGSGRVPCPNASCRGGRCTLLGSDTSYECAVCNGRATNRCLYCSGSGRR